MKRRIIPALAAILTAALALNTACKSSKATTEGETGLETSIADEATYRERLAKTVASCGDWTTFKASGKITISGNSSYSSPMQITMVKGTMISISIRPLLGIEMGRIYITNDTIIICDKVDKCYLAERLEFIFNGIPLGITDMQNIFLSRLFELGSDTVSTTTAKLSAGKSGRMKVSYSPQGAGLSYAFEVDKNCNVQNLVASLEGSETSLYINYYDHTRTDIYGSVAGTIEVSTSVAGSDMALKIEYDAGSKEWDKKVKYSYPIDKRYKRIDAAEYLKGIVK